MRLYTINTGFFKLDGGAMFGVVPKSIWNKLNPSDPNNMCTWAMRCLLIEIDNRLILIDNGIGNKQDEKFFSHYYLHGEDNLNNSLKAAGFSTASNEITMETYGLPFAMHNTGAIQTTGIGPHFQTPGKRLRF
jgi:hypothetical protein